MANGDSEADSQYLPARDTSAAVPAETPCSSCRNRTRIRSTQAAHTGRRHFPEKDARASCPRACALSTQSRGRRQSRRSAARSPRRAHRMHRIRRGRETPAPTTLRRKAGHDESADQASCGIAVAGRRVQGPVRSDRTTASPPGRSRSSRSSRMRRRARGGEEGPEPGPNAAAMRKRAHAPRPAASTTRSPYRSAARPQGSSRHRPIQLAASRTPI